MRRSSIRHVLDFAIGQSLYANHDVLARLMLADFIMSVERRIVRLFAAQQYDMESEVKLHGCY